MANVLISQTGALKAFDATDLLEGETSEGVSFHGDAQSVADLLSQSALLALLDALDEPIVVGLRAAAPGEYTLAKSGVVFKNNDGDEVFRIWGTDPDSANYNSDNLYMGVRAGNLQPTANDSGSGYQNVGVGSYALGSNGAGYGNSGFGYSAGFTNESGNENTSVGYYAGYNNSTGHGNTALGANSGSADGMTALMNTICVGSGVTVGSSNRAVIGNGDTDDVYLGSESAAATLHANGVVFPTSDPMVIGAWWNNAGTLTISAAS